MKIGSLFSGIGGLELGLEYAELGVTAWQAESDPWCRGILARHWPAAVRFADVRDVTAASAPRVDVICGGFPCQDVSAAGKRKGVEHGKRSGLWSEYARILEELSPKIAIIENVPGLRGRGLRRVLSDLSAIGLDAYWTTLGAWEAGAPHQRDRIWIVAADPHRVDLWDVAERIEAGRLAVRESWEAVTRHDGAPGASPHGDGERLEELAPAGVHDQGARGDDPSRCYRPAIARWEYVLGRHAPLAVVRGMDDGLSGELDDHGSRLRALGNAVVPQCAAIIGRAVREAIS